MSSKNKVIIVGVFLNILTILSMIYYLMPRIVININGEKNLTLSYGEEYIEKGANAYIQKIFKNNELEVKQSGKVNTSKIGKYIITYQTRYKNFYSEKIRVVNIVDNIKPKITLNSELKLCKKNNLVKIEATAIDNYDGDITDKIKYKLIDYKIHLFVTDSNNNTEELIETPKIIDDEKPVIKLNGSEIITLNKGETYSEYGATATDSCDGDITTKIKITGKVDTNNVGTYEINYEVEDSSNEKVSIKRKIIVKEPNQIINETPIMVNDATIYLTFDDGPGQYTEQILQILKDNDIKATFFVTNQFPKYQNLIKMEYENGHTVGIHTYSHKWSIYESVESYLDDFNKIEQIVIEQTGNKPIFFRFPGGSSNTVSRNYKIGIMTELATMMTEKGYIYFDWNMDSGDTHRKKNSKNDIISNVKNNLKGDGNYIILMHDIKKNTLEALPEIISYAKTNGYKFDALNNDVNPIHFQIAN